MRSLPVKILALAALNLLLLLAAALVFIRTQLDLGVEGILLAPAQPHLRQLADEISFLTRGVPQAGQTALLQRFEQQTGLELALWENDGVRVAGSPLQPPEPFLREMRTPVGGAVPPLRPPDEFKKKRKRNATSATPCRSSW